MSWLGLLRRNLLRRRGRSTFTLLGVALAIASFLSLASLSRGLQDASQASQLERGVDFIVVQRGMVEVFGGALPESLGAELSRVEGVAEVTSELTTMLELNDQYHALVGGWPVDGFEWKELHLLAGRRPVPGEGGVLVGDALAGSMGLAPGSEITLSFTKLHVTGISRFESPLLRGALQMPLSDMQAVLSRPGQVTLFQVRLKPGLTPAAREQARIGLTAVRPGLLVATSDEALRSSKVIEMMTSASLAIGLVALTMASFSVLNTVAMSVEERVREIGILAAIGWPRRRILGLILSEAVLLAGLGGILGSLLGLLGNQLLVALVVRGSELTIVAGVTQVVLGLAVALLIGGLGAFWPAWRASLLPPATALRRQ